MDPYSSPFIVLNNNPYNPFPHSLLSTRKMMTMMMMMMMMMAMRLAASKDDPPTLEMPTRDLDNCKLKQARKSSIKW